MIKMEEESSEKVDNFRKNFGNNFYGKRQIFMKYFVARDGK